MKKLKFWSLIILGTLLTLPSCVRENILEEKSIAEKVTTRSESETEQLFRQSLRDLISQYDQANTTSTGGLSTLLDNLGDDAKEDALQQLDGSGLINVTLLESTIEDAATYEALLIQEQGVSYVDGVIEEETDNIQARGGRPFWGKRSTFIGIVGGIGGAPCFEYYIETTYRFWINWGSSDVYVEVPCP